MANIAVRNWRWLYNMGVSGCRWFGGLGDYLSVRKMALVGNEAPTIGPDSPTVLTIKVLFAQPGLPIAEQGALGRAQLLGTSFAQYERAFREQLGDMFAPGGFDPRRDIAGIILNRWGMLEIPVEGAEQAAQVAPQRCDHNPYTATLLENVGRSCPLAIVGAANFTYLPAPSRDRFSRLFQSSRVTFVASNARSFFAVICESPPRP